MDSSTPQSTSILAYSGRSLVWLVALFALPALGAPAPAALKAQVQAHYAQLPLSFEANQGQTDKAVRFLAHGPGFALFLTDTEAVLSFHKPAASPSKQSHPAERDGIVRMGLSGAQPHPSLVGLEELPGKVNYLIGRDPAHWHAQVPTYAKVKYAQVYPGIDLVYYGNPQQLEYDFLLAPGADSKTITLAFQGADTLELADGEVVLHTPQGDLHLRKPQAYQERDGVRRPLSAQYALKGSQQVGFEVAAYDPTRPLIIDPVLSYSTYLGGSDLEQGLGIAVDGEGNSYVTGHTTSTNFPVTSGAFQTSGGSIAFVAKLNRAGSALVYATYLGGSVGEFGYGIAVDGEGNAYVTGYTGSTNFPVTPGAFQTSSGGPNDAFVAKLNRAGSALVYATYLGGSNSDYGFGIAVDGKGRAYVTGTTGSTNFPVTPGAFQTSLSGAFSSDAFVAKLNRAGSALVYATYLGGSGGEQGLGIAVDGKGKAYVTGDTGSDNFPVTPGAFQTSLSGSDDAFVAKLNRAGSALVYATYLGGSDGEQGLGIAVDGEGSAYVTGFTFSTNFPVTPGAFQTSFGGGSIDAFVAKIQQ